MACFGVRLSKINKEAKKFIKETNKRLNEEHILNNPFRNSGILLLDNVLCCVFNPIYLNFPKIALFFLFPIIFYFKGFVLSFWYLPPLIMLVATLFWSKYFYFLFLILGLKKEGYDGKIKLIKKDDLIEEFFINGTKRSN